MDVHEFLLNRGIKPTNQINGIMFSDLLEEFAKSAIQDYVKVLQEIDSEPYFGYCDVDGCDGEGCSGGNAWRETGYWTVCSEHSSICREGGEQPKMKQSAIDREDSRGADGILPHNA